jgi:transposase-like protein
LTPTTCGAPAQFARKRSTIPTVEIAGKLDAVPHPHLIKHYTSPKVRKGEVVSCLYRDKDCRVTSWSNARISWPRVQPVGQRGGSGLWVNETLARAIRTESAVALRYWFGINPTSVWKWRREFGVAGHSTTPGTSKAIRGAALKGAAAQKEKDWTDEEREICSARAKHLGLRPPVRWTPKNGAWTKKQLKLLGTDDDVVIAAKIGRTVSAVRNQRTARKIPAHSGWRGGGRGWTETELALLGTDSDRAVAEKIGRTRKAVYYQRWLYQIPRYQKRRERGK